MEEASRGTADWRALEINQTALKYLPRRMIRALLLKESDIRQELPLLPIKIATQSMHQT